MIRAFLIFTIKVGSAMSWGGVGKWLTLICKWHMGWAGLRSYKFMSNVAKRIFAITVTVATVFWSMGLFALPMAHAQSGAQAGDLIKASTPAVYYLADDGKRYVFPNEKTFKTWFSDFSGVKVLSDAELAAIQIGGNITYRSGTSLVKITTDPKVYAVSPGGMLHHIGSEQIAMDLFGSDWNQQIHDVPDAFFTNYSVGQAINSSVPVNGSVVKVAGSSNRYYIEDGKKRMISDAGFAANKFMDKYVRTVSQSILDALSAGADLTSMVASIALPFSSGQVAPPATGGDLMLSAASDNPSSAVVLSSSADNAVLKMNLKAGASGVEVTGLKAKRSGFSNDNNIQNAHLWVMQGDKYMRLGNPVTASDDILDFLFSGSPLKLAANEMVTLIIKLDMASNATSGTLKLTVNASDILSNASAASGSAQSAVMSLESGSNVIGAVSIQVNSLGNSNVDLGEKRDIATYTISETSGLEDVSLHGIWRFTNIGSASDTDYKLKFIGPSGQVLAEGMPSGGETRLDLGNSYTLKEGQTAVFRLQVEIIDGSSRTIQLTIQDYYDVQVKGISTGAGIVATATGASDSTFPIGDASINTLTIAAGTITINKSGGSPSGDVIIGGSDQIIGEYDLQGSGEDMEVQRLIIDLSSNAGSTQGTCDDTAGAGTFTTGMPTTTQACLTGSIKLVANGKTVYTVSATDEDLWDTTPTQRTLSSYIKVPSNSTVKLQVVGNINSNVPSGTKIAAGIRNVYTKRLVSLTFVTASNGTLVSGNALNAVSSTLTITSNGGFGSQTTVAGSSSQKIGSFVVQATSDEAVTITTANIRVIRGGAATSNSITNLLIKDGNTQLGTVVASPNSNTTIGTATNNNFSFALNLAGNSTKVIDVYATIAAGTAGTFQIGIATNGVAATGQTSQQSVTAPSANTSFQTVTVRATAKLTVTKATPPSRALFAGQSDAPLAEFNLRALYEDVNVDEVEVYVFNGSGNISSLTLKDDAGNTLKSNISLVGNKAKFGGLNLNVMRDQTKLIGIYGQVPDVQTLTPNAKLSVFFGNTDATGSISGQDIAEEATTHEQASASHSSVVQYNQGDVVIASAAAETFGVVATAAKEGTDLIGTGVSVAQTDAAAALLTVADTKLLSKFENMERCVVGGTTDCSRLPAVGDIVYLYDANATASTGFIIVTAFTDVDTSTTVSATDTINGVQLEGDGALAGLVTLVAGDIVSIYTGTTTVDSDLSSASAAYAVGDVVAYSDATTATTGGFYMVTTAGAAAANLTDAVDELDLRGEADVSGVTYAASNADKFVRVQAASTSNHIAQTTTGVTATFDIQPGDIFMVYDVSLAAAANAAQLRVANAMIRKGDTIPVTAGGLFDGLTLANGDLLTKMPGTAIGNPQTVHGAIVEVSLSASSPAFGFPIEEQEQLMAIFNVTAKGHAAYIQQFIISIVGGGKDHLTAANAMRVEVDGQSTSAFVNATTDRATIVFSGDGELINAGSTKAFKVYLDTTANSGSWANDETLSVQFVQGNSDGFPGSGVSYRYQINGTWYGPFTIVNNILQGKGNSGRK